MADLSLLAILWNSAFKWVYLSFSPFPPSLPSLSFLSPYIFLSSLSLLFLSEVPITLGMKFKLFAFISIKGKFINYKISHFKLSNLVACSTFPILCKHHLYLVSKYFHHHTPKDPKPIKQLLPICLLTLACSKNQSVSWFYAVFSCFTLLLPLSIRFQISEGKTHHLPFM